MFYIFKLYALYIYFVHHQSRKTPPSSLFSIELPVLRDILLSKIVEMSWFLYYDELVHDELINFLSDICEKIVIAGMLVSYP